MNTECTKILFVSVIVPVYNNSISLEKCLTALSNQTYGRDHYEVLVVDNGSDQPIKENLDPQFSWVRVLEESMPGSYVARNCGIAAASGKILAFTDSDCIPNQDWLEQGVKKLSETPNCGLVAGDVNITTTDHPNIFELFEKLFSFSQSRYVSKDKFGATANVFTYRTVMDKVGTFRPDLKTGGDIDWSWRVAAAGFDIVYAKEAIVDHPARSTFKQTYTKVVRVAGGKQREAKLKGEPTWDLIKNILVELKPPGRLIYWILQDQRIPLIGQRVKMLMLFVIIRYCSAWEKTRILVGGSARRK